MYVEGFSKGYFVDCVLLVEGYLEKFLCDFILSCVFSKN